MAAAPQEQSTPGVSTWWRPSSETPSVQLVLLCAAAALITAGIVDIAQFQDPFVRHDDFCVALGDASSYYPKTLSEGRWVNWLWALRPSPFNLHVLWLLYMGTWSLFAALVGAGLAPRARAQLPVLLAITIALAPQMTNMSRWFATTIPSLVLMTAYAAIAVYGTPRARTAALFAFVPLGIMTHGGSPPLMVAVALGLAGWSGALAELAWFVTAFVVSFAEGLGIVYTINYFAHGYFGVAIASWRTPRPASGALEVVQRTADVGVWLVDALCGMTHLPATHTVPGVLFATVALGLRAPQIALRLGLAAALGTGINGAIYLSTGIETPFRATYYLWPIAVIGVYELIRATPHFIERGLAIAMLCFLFFIGNYHLYLTDVRFGEYQVETRRIADEAQQLDLAPDEPVYILGDPRALPRGGYTAFSSWALQYRLTQLLGREAVVCFNPTHDCEFLEPQVAALPDYPAPGSVVRLPAGQAVVRLSDTPPPIEEDMEVVPEEFR